MSRRSNGRGGFRLGKAKKPHLLSNGDEKKQRKKLGFPEEMRGGGDSKGRFT